MFNIDLVTAVTLVWHLHPLQMNPLIKLVLTSSSLSFFITAVLGFLYRYLSTVHCTRVIIYLK